MQHAYVIKPFIMINEEGYKIEISVCALNRMMEYVQYEPKNKEGGGVLLGRHILSCNDKVIDEITVPIKGDSRGRHFFQRGKRGHQNIIDKLWNESGGTTTYLGEWHTHPEPHPSPSYLDKQEWKRKLNEDIFTGDSLLFIIIGTVSMRIWEGCRNNKHFKLMGEYLHLGHISIIT